MAKEKTLLMKLQAKADTKVVQDFADALEEAGKNSLGLKTKLVALIKLTQQTTAYTDRYITSQKVLNQTFGAGTNQINQYGRSLATMTGISETNISKSLSLFGQMSTSLGMTTEVAEEFSVALTDISSKLSMLYNVDFEQASKSLVDAVKGESSTLTTLTGIVIKNQSLQNTLDRLGIDKQASELNGANLAMIQYITVAEQLNVTNKELQKTVNGVAFQKQVLKNQIQNVYNAFGNLLYPVLQQILPILNAILIVVSNIVNAFARLVGFSGEIADSTGNITGAFSDLSGAIDKANASASKSLRGFDKLNNITTPSNKNGGVGGMIDENILNAFKKANEEMLNIRNRANEIADSIMKWLGFTKDVTGLWKWSAKDLLKNMVNWWGDLNVLGKIFVGLGIAGVFTTIWKRLTTILPIVTKITKLNWKQATSFFKQLVQTGISNNALGIVKVLGSVAGLISVIDGLNKLKTALNDIFSGTADIYSYSEALIGLTEIISGIAIIFGAMTGNVVALGAGIAGIGLSLAGEFGDNMLKANDITRQFDSSVVELNSSLRKSIENAKEDISIKMSQVYRVQELSKELQNYIDQNGKVVESEERVEYILDQLNQTLGTNYEITDGSITLNGKLVKGYEDLEEQVRDYIEALKAQYVQEAYKETYITALQNQQKEQKAVEYANERYKAQLDEINQKEIDGKLTASEAQELRDTAHKEWLEALKEINDKYAENNQFIKDYENLSEALFTGNAENIKKSAQNIMDATVKIAEVDKNKIKEIMSTAQTELQRFESNYKKTQDRLKKYGVAGSMMFNDGAYAYANGGFVDEGQLFIAREAGPELVGKIGNRTAVVNNDQIVNAVASGVARAISSVGGGSSPMYAKIQIGDEEITDWIRVKQNKVDRQFGY